MKRLIEAIGWFIGSLLMLACANVAMFIFVACLDLFLGTAPQFGAPLFVPLLVVVGLLPAGIRMARRRNVRRNLRMVSATGNTAGHGPLPVGATLVSATIIRRKARFNYREERRAYATAS